MYSVNLVKDGKDWGFAPQLPDLYSAKNFAEAARLQNAVPQSRSPMFDVTAIGLAAGKLTTLAFVPQVVKTVRTGSTDDISLGMFLILVIGIAAWLLYGAIIGDLPLIPSNTVTLVLAGTILVFKLKNG
jgi:MtN3 and saliva related transmembrane protein